MGRCLHSASCPIANSPMRCATFTTEVRERRTEAARAGKA